MAIIINDNYSLQAPNKAFDARYFDVDAPWASCAAAIAGIPTYRYQGLTINIAGEEWWWKDGTADGDLVQKALGGTSNLSGATNGLSLFCSSTYVGLGGELTQDTTICGSHILNLGNATSGLTALCGVSPEFYFGNGVVSGTSMCFQHDQDTPHFDICLYGENADSCAGMILDVDVTEGYFNAYAAPNSTCSSSICLQSTDSNVAVYSVQTTNNVMHYVDEACIASSKLTCQSLTNSSNSALNIKTIMDYDTRSWEFCKDNAIILSILSGGTARYGSNVTLTNDCDLAHKWYVDNATGALSANNGLDRQGNNIVLGGDLTGATTICSLNTDTLSLDYANASNSAYIRFQGEDIIDLKTFADSGFTTSETGLQIGEEYFRLTASDNTNVQVMEFCATDGTMVVQDTINSKGLVYAGDYESNFTARSLVTKQYVSGITSGITGAITSANNGLCASGQIVSLGGTLTGDTTIAGGSNVLTFNGLNGFDVTSVSATTCGTTSLLLRSPSISVHDGVAEVINISSACNILRDTTNNEGFVYAGNYCAVGKTNPRWIPDNAYVTGLTSGFITGGTNGLTPDGQNIKLGGTLIETTNICLGGGAATQSFCIENSGTTVCSALDMNGTSVSICASNVNSPNQTGRVAVASSAALICHGFANCYTCLNLSNSLASIVMCGGSSNAQFTFTDATTTQRGIEYADCYHSTYSDRSLVDKEYVISQVSGITGNAITGATNGLTKQGQEVVLGGLLTGDTTIIATGFTCYDIAQGEGDWDGFWFDAANAAVISKGTSDGLCYSTVYLTHTCNNSYSHDDNAGTCSCLGLGANGNTNLNLSNTFTITSDNNCPAQYAGDYSAGYTCLSIPNAGWVTGQTGALQGGNGLTRTGDTIVLGGNLTGTTLITGNNQNLNITGVSDMNLCGNLTTVYGDFAMLVGSDSNVSMAYNCEGNTACKSAIGFNQFFNAIQDDVHSCGISYLTDYSTLGKTSSLWIPDWGSVTGYTNSSISGITNCAITTANNGLTKVGQNVVLGGDLTGNTTICTCSFDFKIDGQDSNSTFEFFDNDAVSSGWNIENCVGNYETTATFATCESGGFPSIILKAEDTSSGDESELRVQGFGTKLIWASGGTNAAGLYMATASQKFCDQINNRGLEYGGDYESNFVPRSLVTCQFVSTCVNTLTGVTSNAITGATNGLTEVNNDVKLGGILTENTTISGGSQILRLGDGGSLLQNLYADVSNATQIQSGSIYLNAGSGGANYKGGNFCFLLDNSNAVFCDNSSGKDGLKYAACISTGFTSDCSVVDKGYVDNATAEISNTVAVCNVTANYTATTTNDFIGVSGATDIYLPATPKQNQRIIVADICGNALASNITIYGNGLCINGNGGATINTDYGAMTFINNGYAWSAVAFIN